MEVLPASFKENPKALLYLIQYEVLAKQEPFESYKTFCKRVGSDVMGFPEFEYWYMRFYQGKSDVDYDRSQDSTPTTLSDLPPELLVKIIDKLDAVSKLSTRHVSKKLRAVVDISKIGTIHHVKIQISKKWDVCIEFVYDGFPIIYEGNGDFTKQAMLDWNSLIKGKKVKIENLEFLAYEERVDDEKVYFDSEVHDVWQKPLEGLKESAGSTGLHVKSVKIISTIQPITKQVLKLLKPETLEHIHMEDVSRENSNVNVLWKLAQWQKAKSIEFRKNSSDLGIEELRYFSNFVEFGLYFPFRTVDLVQILTDQLHKRPQFRKCVISGPYYFDIYTIAQHFNTFVGENDSVRLQLPKVKDSYLQITMNHHMGDGMGKLIVERIFCCLN